MDTKARVLVPEIYDMIFFHIQASKDIKNYYDNSACYVVLSGRHWGVIDKWGNILIPIEHRNYHSAYDAYKTKNATTSTAALD